MPSAEWLRLLLGAILVPAWRATPIYLIWPPANFWRKQMTEEQMQEIARGNVERHLGDIAAEHPDEELPAELHLPRGIQAGLRCPGRGRGRARNSARYCGRGRAQLRTTSETQRREIMPRIKLTERAITKIKAPGPCPVSTAADNTRSAK